MSGSEDVPQSPHPGREAEPSDHHLSVHTVTPPGMCPVQHSTAAVQLIQTINVLIDAIQILAVGEIAVSPSRKAAINERNHRV